MDALRAVLEAHPDPASSAGPEALKCIYETAQCAYVCTACADACLVETEYGDLSQCIRLNLDCAEICAIVGRFLARPGHQDRETLERILEACMLACRACAEECRGHGDMEHCQVCAEQCERCAEACERMVPALVP